MNYLGIVIQTLVAVHQPICSCCQEKLREENFTLQERKTICARSFIFEVRCQNCNLRSEINWDLYLENAPKSFKAVEFVEKPSEELKEREILAEAMSYLIKPTL